MQDLTFLDDYDYTLCGDCHSSITPYNNTSITTITESITTITTSTTTVITKQILSSTNSFTKLLISYHHLHCQKCGLYIEIHPKYDDETSQKIFICSNSDNNNPHKYCLCYHCGLLYGINPNQKSIDIINILQTQIDNMQKEKEKEEQILKKEDLYLAINDEREPENESKKTQEINEREEIEIKEIRQEEIDQERDQDEEEEDDEEETNSNSCSSPREEEEEGVEVNDGHLDDNDDDDDSICELRKENEINKDKAIDESYLNILALKEKLSNIHVSSSFGSLKTASCPTSPNVTNNNASPKSKFNYNTLPKSLHVSPLLGPSTPSPRVLGKEMDEMDKKWQQYLLQQKEDKERDGRDEVNDTNKKLEEQQSQIEALQQLLNKAKTNKTNANNFALIFKRGAYSNKININKS